MTDPQNPVPPKSSWFNDFYKANDAWLPHLLYVVVIGLIAAAFHKNISDIGQNVDFTKDNTAKAIDNQLTVAKYQIGADAPPVKKIEATTQPSEVK